MGWHTDEDLPEGRVYWKDDTGIGELVFSFDRKKEYNLFRDYPYKLTAEERQIFDAENPHWAAFFADRT